MKTNFNLLILVVLINFAIFENLQAYNLGPTNPGKWGDPTMGTPGGVVTWSLMPTGVNIIEGADVYTNSSLYDFMPGGFKTEVEKAFNAWSAVANISFLEVPDGGGDFNSESTGDIRIGGHAFDGAFGTLAHGYFPPVNGTFAAGDIHFDIAENWVIGFPGPGIDISQVLAHEIGHAIGLDHTEVPDSLMNPFYSEAFFGPQADDIAGAQFIYGLPSVGVPEPSTYMILASALLFIILARKRKLKTNF